MPEKNDWLSAFGVEPKPLDPAADEPWIQSVTLKPSADEDLTLSWDLYEHSLRLRYTQAGQLRLDLFREDVEGLQIDEARKGETGLIVQYFHTSQEGRAELRVWPSFMLLEVLRRDLS